MNSERDPGGTDPRLSAGEPDRALETGDAAEGAPVETPAVAEAEDSRNMLPQRERRRTRVERFFVRLVATGGIVGVGVAIAAIMADNGSQGWLVGLVVSIVSVVLAAILWSSRQL